MSNQNEDDDNKDNKPNGPQGPFNFRRNRFAFILLLVVVGLFGAIMLSSDYGTTQEVPYSGFLKQLDEGRVSSVEIIDYSEVQFTTKDQGLSENTGGRGQPAPLVYKSRIPYEDKDLIPELKAKGVSFKGTYRGASPWRILLDFSPFIIGFVLIWFMFRQVQGGSGKAFGFGKSKAKKYDDKGKPTTFKDVAGQEEAKYELQEVVEFLKSPEKFTDIGARIPKGVLLVGSPGTGKTLLAKAVAGEAGVNFFHMSGSDFVEMFVGVGASRVRDLFDQGRKSAPCILFIDEIDAVGRTRGAGYGGGHDEREQTLNQLLVEMDGFDTKDGVIVIAATNRPDVLDPALLRPGRFDRQVVVALPDVKERQAILAIHASRIKLGNDVDLDRLARATPGSSGADLANLVNEAALYAARKGREVAMLEDFEEARDKILMGVARKSRVMSEKERLSTAYHEAGHALLHYHLKNADPLHKVTIIPRGRALGVAFSLPDEDRYTWWKNRLYDQIKICYGGFVAEELVYGQTTSGVVSDLKQATNLARKMVMEWGMSEVLGPQALGAEDEPIFLGKEIATHKDYSEETARAIDAEVKKILTACLEEVRQILRDNRNQLDLLANELVAKETLDDDGVRVLLGLPPRPDRPLLE